MTPDPKLALARQHHQAGNLREAEPAYRQVLAEQPCCIEAMDGLAEVLFRTGNAAGAAELLREAVNLRPQSPELLTNFGIALAAQRQYEDAIARLREALSLRPDLPNTLMNLATVYHQAGKLDDEIATYRQLVAMVPTGPAFYRLAGCLRKSGNIDAAIDAYVQGARLQPDSVQIHNDLANCFYLKDRFHEAIAEYQRTLALRPDYPQGYNNLSISLHEVGRFDEAEASARRAIQLNPNFPEAFYNLGRVHYARRRYAECVAACERALALLPSYVEARNNLALALESLGEVDRAIAEYQTVLAQRPGYLDAKMNYGVALEQAGRIDEAIAVYREILQESPDFEETRWNLGISLLLKGDFENGWRAHESRRKIKRVFGVREFPQPLWTGEPLRGRRILLHTEQGLGDAIQFIRYAPLVKQAGGHVIVLCYEPLRRLFANQPGIDQLVTDRDPLPAVDLQCPLLSLPGIFQTTLHTIPATVPYLRCEPRLVKHWRGRVAMQPARIKVGLVWAGNPAHSRDHDRSIPLSAFAPLAEIDGARFFSLQKGDRAAEAHGLGASLDLIDFTSDLTDFADTAALMANLDLVIAADTAVAHLAGALGKPVWVLLPIAPDWRWMLTRPDSPWYPTMRLFRRTRRGDWSSPIQSIAEQLRSFK
jgi:tetratricopeptide (TPR) repeat protein